MPSHARHQGGQPLGSNDGDATEPFGQSLPDSDGLPPVPGGEPGDDVALDLEVAWPTAFWPLAGVDQEGVPDPAVPVASEGFLEGRLVDVGADHQVGPVASHESREEAVAVRTRADRRPFEIGRAHV